MKIKTILDDEWNTLIVKPFIFVGFHKYKMEIVAIAVSDEGMRECRVIEDSHLARQEIFAFIRSRYPGAPMAILGQKTERFLTNILEEKWGKNTPLKLVIKGPAQRLEEWQTELFDALKIGKNAKISEDNPIQWAAF